VECIPKGLIDVTRSQVGTSRTKKVEPADDCLSHHSRQNLKGYLSRTHQNELSVTCSLWKESHMAQVTAVWPGPLQSRSHSGEKLLTWKLKSFVKQTDRNIQRSTFKPICLDPRKKQEFLFEILLRSSGCFCLYSYGLVFKSGPRCSCC
jgi:hypothetical protein